MAKLTKEQIDSIRNAKTRGQAYEVYMSIRSSAFKAYENWAKPNPDYSKMSKEELIELLKEKESE